jgi:hypothetical protein
MKRPDKRMHPVENESILRMVSALCENERESTSVRSADLRPKDVNVYRTDGRAPAGSKTSDGVLNEKNNMSETNDVVKVIFDVKVHHEPLGPLWIRKLTFSIRFHPGVPRTSLVREIKD